MDSAASDIEPPSDALPSLNNPANPIKWPVVVQRVLELFEDPSYLEIGVNRGTTFHFVQATQKVAVDPKAKFDYEAAAAADPSATFHQTTSDNYFGSIATPEAPFDVIFLDGLHTSQQTLRDLVNSISFLKPGGVIIIDDVFPSSYEASQANPSETHALYGIANYGIARGGPWMGDVYRLVFFIESFFQQFSYCTVNNNHGMLIMWREPRQVVPARTLREVADKEYKDIILEKQSLRCASLEVILAKIQAARR